MQLESKIYLFDNPADVCGLTLRDDATGAPLFAIDGSSLADDASQLAAGSDASHCAVDADGHPCDTYDSAADLCRDLANRVFDYQRCGYTVAEYNNGAISGSAIGICVSVYYRPRD